MQLWGPQKEGGEKETMEGKRLEDLGISGCGYFTTLLKPAGYRSLGGMEKDKSKQSL